MRATLTRRHATVEAVPAPAAMLGGELMPIGSARWRQVVDVRGVVGSLRVVPWVDDAPVLECTIFDETGGLILVFLGRRSIGGLGLGRLVEATGRVIEARSRLVIMNPVIELLH